MHEVKERTRIVGSRRITTYSREIYSANILEVEAGTNGYCGGDTGHGSRTYFRIEDKSSTDMVPTIIEHLMGANGLEVALGGDCELATIIEALKFIVQVLEDQAELYGDPYGGE